MNKLYFLKTTNKDLGVKMLRLHIFQSSIIQIIVNHYKLSMSKVRIKANSDSSQLKVGKHIIDHIFQDIIALII